MNEPIRTRTDLLPYSADYTTIISSWIDSVETLYNVCRGTDFPPSEDIIDSWQREGVNSFILFAENNPVAYGEIWNRPQEMAVMISHLLVAPVNREQGFGVKMLNLLYEKAANRSDIAKVIINLYNENPVALGCIMKAGFELVGTTSYTQGLRLVKIIK